MGSESGLMRTRRCYRLWITNLKGDIVKGVVGVLLVVGLARVPL